MRSSRLSISLLMVALLAGACADKPAPRARPAATRAAHTRTPLQQPGVDCAAAPLYEAAVQALEAIPGSSEDFWSSDERREALEHPASWASAPAKLRALASAPAGTRVIELTIAAANCADGTSPGGPAPRYLRLGRFLQTRAIADAYAGRPAEAALELALTVQLGGDLTRGAGILESFLATRLQQRGLELTSDLVDLGLVDHSGAQLVATVAERALTSAPPISDSLARDFYGRLSLLTGPLAQGPVCTNPFAVHHTLCHEVAIAERIERDRHAARRAAASLRSAR